MRSYVLLLDMRLEVAGKALSSLPETRNSDFEDLPQLKDIIKDSPALTFRLNIPI